MPISTPLFIDVLYDCLFGMRDRPMSFSMPESIRDN